MINVKIYKMIALFLATSFVVLSSGQVIASCNWEKMLVEELAKKKVINQLNVATRKLTKEPKDPDGAVKICKEMADRGLEEAKKRLPQYYHTAGYTYLVGEGVNKNIEKGFKYLELAKEARYKTTLEYWSNICFLAGQGYYAGDGASKNLEKGIQYCQEASEAGLEIAKRHLQKFSFHAAKCFLYGYDVPRNPELALKYRQLAEKSGHPEAKGKLGLFQATLAADYCEGNGIPRNLEEAVKYCKLAIKNGVSQYKEKLPVMQFALAKAYADGDDAVKPNPKKALLMYEELSKGDDEISQRARINYNTLKERMNTTTLILVVK